MSESTADRTMSLTWTGEPLDDTTKRLLRVGLQRLSYSVNGDNLRMVIDDWEMTYDPETDYWTSPHG